MVMDSTGRTIRIERKLHENYLPQKAKDKLKSLDPNYTVVSVYEVTDSKEKITYKTIAKISRNFTFDQSGSTLPEK